MSILAGALTNNIPIITSWRNGVPGIELQGGGFYQYTPEDEAYLNNYNRTNTAGAQTGALMNATNTAASRPMQPVATAQAPQQGLAPGASNIGGLPPGMNMPSGQPLFYGTNDPRSYDGSVSGDWTRQAYGEGLRTSRTTDGTVSSDWTRGPAVGTGTTPNLSGLGPGAGTAPANTNPYMGGSGNNPLGTNTTAASGTGVTNPYMQLMSNAITQTANQNLTRNLLPAINRGSVAMGGYGDSRMGIAQGIAAGDTQQGITNALAGLYGNAYNVDRSYDLSRIGQDQGFYTAQRGQDLQQQQLQGNQYLQALNATLGLGQGVTGIGNQQMLASLFPYQAYANLLNPLTGLNQSNTTQQPGSGGGLSGALGGGLTVAQLLNLINGG